jgi:hypothetical protein
VDDFHPESFQLPISLGGVGDKFSEQPVFPTRVPGQRNTESLKSSQERTARLGSRDSLTPYIEFVAFCACESAEERRDEASTQTTKRG